MVPKKIGDKCPCLPGGGPTHVHLVNGGSSGRLPLLQIGGDDMAVGGEIGLLHPGQQSFCRLTADFAGR